MSPYPDERAIAVDKKKETGKGVVSDFSGVDRRSSLETCSVEKKLLLQPKSQVFSLALDLYEWLLSRKS
jgi:hypothetical protein